jgi:predicted acyltransferase
MSRSRKLRAPARAVAINGQATAVATGRVKPAAASRPQTATPPSPVRDVIAGRLHSIDALRGFNMFWIIGGAELFAAVARACHWQWLDVVSDNLTEHATWEGCHFHDMIFPLFLFIMGVTAPFSLAKRAEQGASRSDLALGVVKRAALLFLLGLIYNGALQLPGFDQVRIMGVLQRLGIAYGCAALIYLFTSLRGQVIAAVSLLLVYFAAMCAIHVPGHHLADFSPEGNVANYIDRLVFLPHQLYLSYGDPEGLFSTLPAIVTALLGIFAGQWLRTGKSAQEKVLGLVAAGALCIAAGYAWSPWFPVIKKIWTSSYVLVVGGWSMLLLAAFYWVIDVRGWKKWAYFFAVIGLNPLTIYIGQRFIDFGKIAHFFCGGVLHLTGGFAPIGVALSVLAVKWLFLRYFYKQRIYLRV